MRRIGEEVWVCERRFRFMGAEFGNRMTVIRSAGGALMLHSPVALDEELARAVRALGHVAHVITPNAFHGLFAAQWCAAFPDAQYFTAKEAPGSEGRPLQELSRSLAGGEVEMVHLAGIPRLNEFAFFHRPSATLILTDLAFNIGWEGSWWTRLFFTLNGARGRFGPTRLMRSMVEDRAALRGALLQLLEWEFERIVLSHGEVVERGGRALLAAAFREYLAVVPLGRRNRPFTTPLKCG